MYSYGRMGSDGFRFLIYLHLLGDSVGAAVLTDLFDCQMCSGIAYIAIPQSITVRGPTGRWGYLQTPFNHLDPHGGLL